MRFLSLAALALVGAVMTGCSNEDDFTVEPENKSNVVTLTTTVGIGGGAETRALAADGTKTFAAGETMAVIYKNTSGTTVKAVSAALVAGNITGEGKSATFTFELEDPDREQKVKYIYPAAMAGETDVDYSNLNSQDGTLATLSSNLDLATYWGAWDGASLPSATLDNQLAILVLTLKDSETSDNITSTITEMTVSDGTNTYSVSPSSLSTIYVAIQPTTSANIEVTATDGSTNYTKSLTGKTYSASNGYPLSWLMAKVVPECSYTAPTLVGSTLTYNGSAQALVTGGSATNATIYYSTNGGSSWSTSVPTGTNAGTYTVHYKVEPADGYSGGVASTSLGTKTINKANRSGSVTVTKSGSRYIATYNGTGTITKWQDSKDGSTWYDAPNNNTGNPYQSLYSYFRVTIAADTNYYQATFNGHY